MAILPLDDECCGLNARQVLLVPLSRIAARVQFGAMLDRHHQLRTIAGAVPGLLSALAALRQVDAREGAIGAGFVRSAVWDHLCGFPLTPVEDVDVLYFDPTDLSWDAETAIERRLRDFLPGLPWSVRNQARMHLRNGDPPYRSVAHAMSFWLETPTCVALRLDPDDSLTVIAPFGLDDLFHRRIRPTPRGKQRATAYVERANAKRWHERWPGVVLTMPAAADCQ